MNGLKGYISIGEASCRWGVSRFGRSWAISENAEKPSDLHFKGTVPQFRQDKHLTDTTLHWKHPQKGSEQHVVR